MIVPLLFAILLVTWSVFLLWWDTKGKDWYTRDIRR